MVINHGKNRNRGPVRRLWHASRQEIIVDLIRYFSSEDIYLKRRITEFTDGLYEWVSGTKRQESEHSKVFAPNHWVNRLAMYWEMLINHTSEDAKLVIGYTIFR